jgi:ERF superfamily
MQVHGNEQQTVALFNALIAAQAEFPAIPKTKSAYNYKYAPLPEIHTLIRPILIKHGLAVLHPITTNAEFKTCVGTVVIHKDGGSLASEGLIIPELKAQEQGSFVTYGNRYGYCSMLGLTSQDDDDAAMASGKTQRRGNARAVAPIAAAKPVDPDMPSAEERQEYKKKIDIFKQHVSKEDLQGYLLAQSGASEVRFMTRAQWNSALARLDHMLTTSGPDSLNQLVTGGANARN